MATTFEVGFDKAFDEAQTAQSTDQAPEPTKEAEATETPAAVEEKPTEAQPESSELLPQEEYDKLRSDPEALRKALNKAFTQKTQALSEERKALEPYKELIESFREDPQGTVRALAEKVGLNLGQVETKAEVKDATGELVAELKKDLGPELEFLADKLAPALERIVNQQTGKAISKEIEPLKQETQRMREETVKQQIDANLELFSKKHPDWRKYEAKMTEIGQVFQPGKDPKTGKPPTWMEYMENLYYLSTKDEREAETVKKTVERMKTSASKTEHSEGGTSSNKVTKAAPKYGSFDEAFDQSWSDAKDGILYE